MTPTQKAAMTAALEALEILIGWANARIGTYPGGYPGTQAATAITALRVALAETAEPVAGWRLVPVEPTPEMLRAAQEAQMDHGDHEDWLEYEGGDVKRIHRAMLNAAPQPPAPAVECDCEELLAALQEIADDYADRFDLNSPSTNPGIKSTIKQARAAIAAHEARKGGGV